SFVLPAFSQRGDIFEPLGYARLSRLHVQYGGIQLLLGCKVPENSHFVDPGGKRDLFCGGSPESLLGEKPDCGFENLLADNAAGAIFGSGHDIARSVHSSADPSCHYILSSRDGKHVPACMAQNIFLASRTCQLDFQAGEEFIAGMPAAGINAMLLPVL